MKRSTENTKGTSEMPSSSDGLEILVRMPGKSYWLPASITGEDDLIVCPGESLIYNHNIIVYYKNIRGDYMCNERQCKPPENAPPKWLRLRNFVRALRFQTRWLIIECIGEDSRSTNEIYDCLTKKGEQLTKSGLYYHLSELKNAGIIEVAGYIEDGAGAPEKLWKLKTKKIVINLVGEE
ncbi:winged helix-turn-helix domain-containing protein [Thermococcus peptonophilus]|nr:helix-turn-helix domain-containing protein [Thermococcus peptonophilus]